MGLGSDFAVKGVIEAFVSSEGFRKALEQFDAIGAKARQAGEGMKPLNDQTAKLADGQKASGREVRQLTSNILHSIGIQKQAGEAGQFMAAALEAARYSSQMLNLALAGTGLAVVILLPKIIEWIKQTQGVSEEQKKLTEALVAQLPQLESYAQAIGKGNIQLNEQLKIARELAVIKQEGRVEEINKELEALQRGASGVRIWRQEHADAFGILAALNAETGKLVHQETAEEKAARAQALAIAGLRLERQKLLDAIAQGKSVAQIETEERAKADAAKKAEQERIDASFDRMNKQVAYDNQLLDEEFKADDARKAAEAEQELDGQLHVVQYVEQQRKKKEEGNKLERERADASARIMNEEILRERQGQAVRRAGMVSLAQASIGLLGGIFKKNKAAAIAQAIIDTFTAANAALKNPPGPPWTIPFAAAAVVMGMQNVQAIRKQGAGFDNPASDAVAREFGYRWAADLVGMLNTGFTRGLALAGSPVGGSSYVTNNYGTTINGGFHAGGFFGENETELFKRVKRRMDDPMERLERRTRIGG